MPRSFPFALLRVKMTSHTRPANLRDITLDICILAVRANVDQRETRSLAFRLDSHDVLVLPGPDFEFDVIAPAAAASQFMRAALGVVGHVRVKVEMVCAVTLENIAVLLQLIPVKGDQLLRCCVRLILQGDNFERESEAGDVYVRALVVTLGALRLQARPWIDGQSGVRGIRLLANMNPAHWGLNVDLLVLTVCLLLHIDTASRKQCQAHPNGNYYYARFFAA